MTDVSFDVADDPWQMDDFQRRAMQFLFREGPTQLETQRRRGVRSALLGLFSAVAANDAIDLNDAMRDLWTQYNALYGEQIQDRDRVVRPVPAHPNDFDVVAYQPPETT